MRETGGRGAGALGLDLRGVDFDADGPGEGEDDGEEVDGDDDEPAAGAGGRVDGVGGVEGADEEHGGAEADAAGDDAVSAAPAVGPEEAWDGHGEDDEG